MPTNLVSKDLSLLKITPKLVSPNLPKAFYYNSEPFQRSNMTTLPLLCVISFSSYFKFQVPGVNVLVQSKRHCGIVLFLHRTSDLKKTLSSNLSPW